MTMRLPLKFSAACILAGVLSAQAQGNGPALGPQPPEPPPTYEIDKKGKRAHIDFNLAIRPVTEANLKLSQVSGRKLLLFYFSAKCPQCRHAFPHVQKISDSLSSKGFVSLAIAVKFNTDEDIRGFIRDYGVRMPVFQDSERVFGEHYGTGSIPLVLLVNEKGEYIRYKSFDDNVTPAMLLREGKTMAMK
jgi:thiol-disulfide isomerase/thioredoxin